MNVVAHGPHAWFLLKEGSSYFLSARCSRSATEFEVLIELTPVEYREYHAIGYRYIDYLAARVAYWSDEYLPRHQGSRMAETHETILAWLATHGVDNG